MIYVSADGSSGYAVAAQAYVAGLLRVAEPLSWSPRAWRPQDPGHVDVEDAEMRACLGQALATDRVLLHVVPAQLDPLLKEFSAYRKFVYTAWETERLPESWAEPLNQAERIFVPCHWNEVALKASGVTAPVKVIPHLVCEHLAALKPDPPPTPFTFYCIGPWTRRKAMDLLVEAFCRAFAQDEPVRLLLKTENTDLTRYSRRWGWRHFSNAWNSSARALQRILKKHRRPPEVKLLFGKWPQRRIWELHTRCHCFVSLTRAEGWGLGAFEAATVGNPVIMTGYGGQLDFLDASLASLIDHRIVACEVGPWESFYVGHNWAEPDLDHAAALMREVYAGFPAAQARAGQLKQRICEEFSWNRVIPRFQAALS